MDVESQDKKRELIIQTALKRFAHFGLAKTTMTEIANDLSLSKALLYYYFPDKINLYAAVLNNIFRQMDKALRIVLDSKLCSEQTMLTLLRKRAEFLVQYYNLLDFNKITGSEVPEVLNGVFQKFKTTEMALFLQIIDRGVAAGELDPEYSTAEAATILSDSLKGIVFNDLHPASTKLILPKKEQFDQILAKQVHLVKIFFRGLRKS